MGVRCVSGCVRGGDDHFFGTYGWRGYRDDVREAGEGCSGLVGGEGVGAEAVFLS